MQDHDTVIAPARVLALFAREEASFRERNPRSAELAGAGLPGFYDGVPMHWMRDWPTPFPLVVAVAQGARLTDVDGHVYDDFCLGDTGAMFGHSPPAVATAISRQAERGLTTMLASEDAAEVGRLLQVRFGLPHWQVATTEAALAHRDVACVITEPVLTNSCMVLPDPGFHAALRRLSRDTGSLLLIDETHTISTGPGGYTRAHGLEPDLFVLGKPIAGGVPAAVWGFTDAVAGKLDAARAAAPPGHSGMGTTLSANALALAAMRAMLELVMTDAAYGHMEMLAAELEAGLGAAIARLGLRWHVVRVGARVEFVYAPGPLGNGRAAEAAQKPDLERAINLALLNRGSLIAPFHNMMLTCPATTRHQVQRLCAVFEEVLADARLLEE